MEKQVNLFVGEIHFRVKMKGTFFQPQRVCGFNLEVYIIHTCEEPGRYVLRSSVANSHHTLEGVGDARSTLSRASTDGALTAAH